MSCLKKIIRGAKRERNREKEEEERKKKERWVLCYAIFKVGFLNLKQHAGRVLHKFLKLVKPFSSDGTIDNAMIAGERHCHECGYSMPLFEKISSK